MKKFILSKIFGKLYYRTGKCNACGKCCEKIYVKHFNHVIQDEEEFKKLQFMHRFYTYLKVVDKDETGLVFECQNLDKDTRKCKIHKSRPGICRRYPQEELFTMGGALSDDCGYQMKPIIPFEKVLQKASKKSLKLILFFMLLTSISYARNGFSETFIQKLKNCELYSEQNSVNLKGTVFNDVKFFYKDDLGMCRYTEVTQSIYGNITYTCTFSPEQISSLYTLTNINNLDEMSSTLWNSYLNDSSVCNKEIKMFIPSKPLVPDNYLPWEGGGKKNGLIISP